MKWHLTRLFKGTLNLRIWPRLAVSQRT
jgi:hypothetical protein